MDATDGRIIDWHRELPPFDAETMGEHIVEVASGRMPGTLAHRDELWSQCYEDLMAQVRIRLKQEVARLGGNYAHALNPWTVSMTTSPANLGYTVASPTPLPPGLKSMTPARLFRLPPCSYRAVACATIPFAAVMPGSR